MDEGKQFKMQLLVGEGSLSYACALLRKHPELVEYVIVTAYDSEEKARAKYPGHFPQNYEFLKSKNVRVLFNVDGRRLHEHELLRTIQFDSIHFNFPHDGGSFETNILRGIIREFCLSARQLQPLLGRIYMALVKEPSTNTLYKLHGYDIYENTRNAGYRLVDKHRFGKERYPGYRHVQTKCDESVDKAENHGREYVFEKTDLSVAEILHLDNSRRAKPSWDYKTKRYVIPEITTDGNSTDYHYIDLTTRQLFPLPDVQTAKDWFANLVSRRNKILDMIAKGVMPEPTKSLEFSKRLHSLEIFLTGCPFKFFYTHNSGLRWKEHIAIWYYRGCLLEENSVVPNSENKELKDQFVDFLLETVEKCVVPQSGYFMMHALESLFYLFPYRPADITKTALKIIGMENANYRAKAIAFCILLKHQKNANFCKSTLITQLLRVLGYDPRLDWMICKFLGHFDITDFLLNKDFRSFFEKVKDLRLILIMLDKSDHKKLVKKKKKLPNRLYERIAVYLWKTNKKKQLDEDDQVIAEAVRIPQVFSLCFKNDMLLDKKEFLPTSLIANIFMPACSMRAETILTGLRDSDQEPSFLALGRYYREGTHGCAKNIRKALSFFRMCLDNGSADPEVYCEVLRCYAEGLADVGAENPGAILLYCEKLKVSKDLRPDQSILGFIVRGLVMLFQNQVNEAQIYISVALQKMPNYENALFIQAVLSVLTGTKEQWDKALSKVAYDNIYKRGLNFFLENSENALEKIASVFKSSSSEQLSLMFLFCAFIAFKQDRPDVSLKYLSQILKINPLHHVALNLCRMISPDATPPNVEAHASYKLIFKHYETKEDYIREKEILQRRCTANQGFFVLIMIQENLSEAFYLSLSGEKVITASAIIEVAEKIVRAFHSGNTQLVPDYMRELHHYVIGTFGVQPVFNLSMKLDEIERVEVIDTPEKMAAIEREIAESKERDAEETQRISRPGEEAEVPEDIDGEDMEIDRSEGGTHQFRARK